MKKSLLALIMLCLSFLTNGQVIQIIPGTVSSIQLNEEAILNVQVNSMLRSNFSGNFKLILQDAKGIAVISFYGVCSIKPGQNRFNTMIQQKNVNVSNVYKEFIRTVGTLPPGEYQICLDIESVSEPVMNYSDCGFIDSYPLFDLTLNFPENNGFVGINDLPFFNWFFISPLPLSEIKYEFKLVEKMNNQSTQQAVVTNPALFYLRNHNFDSYQYQPINFPLNNGNVYAWTVDAFYLGFLVARAIPFDFKVQIDTSTVFHKITNSYIDVRDASKGNYFVKEAIKLRFRSFQDRQLDYLIVETKSGEIISKGIVPSENSEDFRVVVELKKLNLKRNTRYKLETINGERYEVFFTYVQD